ncbi:MBL fold metallo-hydrolase [Paenibacillus sp. SYP-B3998]|uniref:MBL fold metallo-hydrolase n=1 Tax=Paenibacillus sp. SYP-B3998 TaxID=2678564 RepID=A0A6G4A646_9BACL|nr:MBL fold metallo-hydrolase [Paenibacillus sp. SYP-B3998]NEW09279.1 MBL fold metallo-hydrolase [Paenibacillus sp. SYP-B3998]
MKIQMIRNATLWLEYAGVTFLIDPMFSEAGANPPIPGSANERRNPLVSLPGPIDTWLRPDAVIVTHLHPDHWDDVAVTALPKAIPVLCQPGDEEALTSQDFHSVTAVESTITFQGIRISRTDGQHGTGEIGLKMGHVSGFVFQTDGEQTLYIAGDTIWCKDVEQSLDDYRPDVTVVNAGGAQFVVGDPITMNADDIIQVCEHAPYTKVVAVHMDAINHCFVTREDLYSQLQAVGRLPQVIIPKDGEWV